MGFEEAAIQSIRANRGQQRKKNTFGLSAGSYHSANVNIDKIPVDEARMEALKKRANQKELIFWLAGIITGLGIIWWIL